MILYSICSLQEELISILTRLKVCLIHCLFVFLFEEHHARTERPRWLTFYSWTKIRRGVKWITCRSRRDRRAPNGPAGHRGGQRDRGPTASIGPTWPLKGPKCPLGGNASMGHVHKHEVTWSKPIIADVIHLSATYLHTKGLSTTFLHVTSLNARSLNPWSRDLNTSAYN
jgi:hypothetical protein